MFTLDQTRNDNYHTKSEINMFINVHSQTNVKVSVWKNHLGKVTSPLYNHEKQISKDQHVPTSCQFHYDSFRTVHDDEHRRHRIL